MGLYISMFVCFYCDAIWDEDPTRPKYIFFAEGWAVKNMGRAASAPVFPKGSICEPGRNRPVATEV